MQVIYWPELQFAASDVSEIAGTLKGAVHVRLACQTIVRTVLKKYPWKGRSDLLPIFDPGQNYEAGQIVALPVIDTQELRPDAWQFAKVKQVEETENPIQGKFQVVTLETQGKIEKFAAQVTNAKPLKLRFSLNDPEQFDILVSYFGDAFAHPLQETIKALLTSGRLKGQFIDDYVLMGKTADLLSEKELHILSRLFDELPATQLWLTTDEILKFLMDMGHVKDVEHQIGLVIIRGFLSQQGYVDLDGDRWTTDKILGQINRPIERTITVPRMRSRLAKELKSADEDEKGKENLIDELPEDAQQIIQEWGEDDTVKEQASREWVPPSTPARLPTLSYLHLAQGYFPLQKVRDAFDPAIDLQIASIQVVDGERLLFLVSREEGVLKAVEVDLNAFREKFLEKGIPAGTHLWLEYQGGMNYRIAPRPLSEPRNVLCKLAHKDDGRLVIEQAEIPMLYEGEPHVFKAELRFEDMAALFAEAEISGLSLLDATLQAIQELTALEDRVYYTDIFNAVFLKRMFAFGSVISTLYSHPCFEKLGDGYFRFAPEKGIRRAGKSYKHHPQQKPVDSPIADAQPVAGESFGIEQPQENDLASLVEHYLQRPNRPKTLLCRAYAHQKIRELLEERGLAQFSLADFNQHVWQFGSFHFKGKAYMLESKEGLAWFQAISYPDFKQALDSGELTTVGNQTWGSGSHVYGAMLQLPEEELESLLRQTLKFMLYGDGDVHKRVDLVLSNRNGFGINVISGILLAMYPGEHVLYNNRSVSALQKLGVDWPRRWITTEAYTSYRTWCLDLLGKHGFESLADVDLFMYHVSANLLVHQPAQTAEESALGKALEQLEGQKLHTLEEQKVFFVEAITPTTIEIQTSTGQRRKINRQSIESAWDRLQQVGKLDRAEIRDQVDEFNPAYIAAILASLPGVEHQTKPIRLFLSGREIEEKQSAQDSGADQLITLEKTRSGQTVAPGLLPPEPLFAARKRAEGPETNGQAVPQETLKPAQAEIEPPVSLPDFRPFVGRMLYTLRYVLPFQVESVVADLLSLQVSKKPRAIPLKEFTRAWEKLVTTGEYSFIEKFQEQPGDSAFIAAIISTLPGVKSFREQSRLEYYAAPGAVETPAEAAQPPATAVPVPTATPPRRTHTQRSSLRPGDDMQNKPIFAHHYLELRLPQHPEWSEDPRPVLEQILPLWQKAVQHGDSWSEAQTEEEFIKPILTILGWSFIVQVKSISRGKVTRPDYALFADDASKQASYPHQGNDDAFYSRALGIAEAKYWGRPLSEKDSSGRATWKENSNPSHQMVSYLVGTRSPWGILTNGRTWRLYSREVSSTASEYYEIDLGALFDLLPIGTQPTEAQLDQFKRWWLFFRRRAFTAEMGGKSFVQQVHEGSATYAREISDKLKELVFEEVMPEIAGGFVAYRHHQLNIQETPESLSEIYRASLSLLYKMLFLLYAEARGLLPMENPAYQQNSLTALAQWAAEQIDRKQTLSAATHASPRYEALLALFRRVDRGDPSLGIPHYNGGLFSPASPENQFLEKHKLSDRAIAQAIDVLVRDAGQPVDYAYISVRNLGAIYEGLLENRLQVRDAASGNVELINDKGERKASGSYYTPDYIVAYIVQNTLDPILDARQAEYERGMGRVTDLRKKLLKVSDAATAARLRGELDDAERQAREAFLGIKVLDPAMGSGHFLVNAVDHLTDGIIQRMQAWHDAHTDVPWGWDPIQQLIERVRAEILQEMESQGLHVDARRLDDTALLTRLVMKRCVYGVDLNRMAVELAKVSLWLHSFTVGAPLSFLDHHLRWGNSLIGADVRTVEKNMAATKTEKKISAQAKGRARARGETVREVDTAFQSNLFGGPFAGLLDLTAVMIEVAERADATLADVRESAKKYEELQDALIPYKQALNLWVSQYFDNKRALEIFASHKDRLLDVIRNPQSAGNLYTETLTNSQKLWEEKRFFHWDLEFPEVFVDLRKRNWAENGGFDAVIGNPPWLGVRTGEIEHETLNWLKEHFTSAIGQYDLSAVFLELSSNIIANSGTVGMVVPKRLATNESYADLRKLLAIDLPLLVAIDLGIAFEGVNNDALIMISGSPAAKDVILGVRSGRSDLITWKVNRMVLLNMPFYIIPVNSKADAISLIEKIGTVTTVAFGTMVTIIRGAECGMNDPSIAPPGKGEGIYLVDHLDVSRFTVDYSGWRIDPAKISPAKLKPIPIYQKVPKILIRFLSADIIAGMDLNGYASTNLVYHAHLLENSAYNLYALCGILSSRLLSFWYRTAFQNEEVKFPHVQKSHLEKLPIRRIDFTTPAETRAAELARARALYEAGQMDSLLALTQNHLPEQADIAHDVLAYLAEQMIEPHKARQAEMKGFLAWLGRETSVDLQTLTGKTTLFNYLGDYQKGEEAATLEQILAVLRKNQRSLRVDVSARTFQERLAKEYEASLGKLLPVKARLSATDRLIDQIVYALYGLTDEEIAIVEQKSR